MAEGPIALKKQRKALSGFGRSARLTETCAKLCHVNGGELEQIQFFLGYASVLTTERYLGCKQNLEEPVNNRFGRLFSTGLDSR